MSTQPSSVPAELVSLLEGLPEPHILIDEHYHILAANTAYRRQFGSQQEVVQRKCYEVSHHFSQPCDQAGETCPRAQALLSGQVQRVLHLHHTPQGEEYVQIELTPMRSAKSGPVFFIEKIAHQSLVKPLQGAQGLVGQSPAFRRMLALVARVAPSQASVLLLGESGTGKELVAHALHRASHRAHRPLVPVDCSSLPESLFESELFGHEKGAFTGATQARPGLVESACSGTLFLDEVGDIPLAQQVKLLRLLETGTYRRVGSTELRHADIRVISATHRHLAQRVAEGRFREDLYYRLGTFPIHLPSLRERRDDIAPLSRALLERVAPERALTLAAGALALLEAQPFPGNVRELRNLLERAALLCDGCTIGVEQMREALACGLAPVALAPPAGLEVPPDDATLAHRLAEHQGSRADLAQRLGMSERSLYRRLRLLKGTGAAKD